MSAPPASKLDSQQVLKHAFDDSTGRLRTDAAITVDDIDVQIDQSTDSIKIGDGTNLVTATQDGGKTGLDVNIINDIAVDITHVNDSIRLGDGTNLTNVTASGELQTRDNGANTSLSSINNKLPSLGQQTTANSLSVTLPSDQGPLTINLPSGAATEAKQDVSNSSLASIDSKLSAGINSLETGTEDGSLSGTQRVFVNNRRQQVLAAHDRQDIPTYTLVGNKYRLDYITYTSPTFPGISVRKSFTWADFGSKNERVTNIVWTVF